MELEDLKKAWDELNLRITRNELTNQKILSEMLMQRKESAEQYFSRWRKASIVATLFVWSVVPYLLFTRNTPLGISVLLLLVMLVSTVITAVSHIKWKKILKWENIDIEKQTQYILGYKIFVKCSYIIIYILILPIVVYAYYYTHLWGVLTSIIVVAALADYFIYHTTAHHLRDFSKTIRELKELKEMQ